MNELELSNTLRMAIYALSFLGIFVIGIYIHMIVKRDDPEEEIDE